MNSNTLSNANNQSDILFTFSSSFKKKYTLELAYFFRSKWSFKFYLISAIASLLGGFLSISSHEYSITAFFIFYSFIVLLYYFVSPLLLVQKKYKKY